MWGESLLVVVTLASALAGCRSASAPAPTLPHAPGSETPAPSAAAPERTALPSAASEASAAVASAEPVDTLQPQPSETPPRVGGICLPMPAADTCLRTAGGELVALGEGGECTGARVVSNPALAAICWRDGEFDVSFGARCDLQGGLCGAMCTVTCRRDGSRL